jgi:hypothetical protein
VFKSYYKVAPMIYTSERVWREELSNLPAPDLTESPLWLKHYPCQPRENASILRVAERKHWDNAMKQGSRGTLRQPFRA